VENLKAIFPLVYNDRRFTLSIQPVAEQQDGYLKYTDWKEFKEKVATNKTISTKAPLYGGGDLSNNREVYITQADSKTDGYLLAQDYRDFKSKYPFPKGLKEQYLKGDGSIGNNTLHTEISTSGITYYLNAEGNGVIDGITHHQLGAKISSSEKLLSYYNSSLQDGLIAAFISDLNSPNQILIPIGRWSLDIYASCYKCNENKVCIYAELYKYSGGSVIPLAKSEDVRIINPDCDIYTIPIEISKEVELLKEDRIVLRVFSRNIGNSKINIHLGNQTSVLRTNISNAITSLNGITASIQAFKFKDEGLDVSIKSEDYTHYFNIPTASDKSRGLLSPNDYKRFSDKQDKISTGSISEGSSDVLSIKNADNSVLKDISIDVKRSCDEQSGYLHYTDFVRFGNKVSANRSIKVKEPLTGGGDLSQDRIIGINEANESTDGYLSADNFKKFNGKQDKITGAATTILDINLDKKKVLISNELGKIVTGDVGLESLNQLRGIRANIQDQINEKAPILSPIFRGNPEAQTPKEHSNNNQIATTAYVDRRASFIPFSLGTIISSFSPADKTNYYFGALGNPYSLTPHTRFISIPSACMIKDMSFEFVVGGTMPSKEFVSLYVCIYDISNYHLGTHLISDRVALNNQYRSNKYHFKNLNLHIKENSFIVLKMVVDSFMVNPTQVYGAGTISII
jgi:hypothetical protein